MLRVFPVTKEKLIALVYGIVCHCLFILAAILMSLSLFSGFSWQVSLNSGSSLTWINLFLLIQFPFFHSLLLMPSGKRRVRIFSSSKLIIRIKKPKWAFFNLRILDCQKFHYHIQKKNHPLSKKLYLVLYPNKQFLQFFCYKNS